MPNVFWNSGVWGSTYRCPAGGEEWSKAWGGGEAQWFGSIYPRLHRFLPAQRILEIAPGFGRWSKFLILVCEEFVGILVFSFDSLVHDSMPSRMSWHPMFRRS